jgi:hypothetical protein
VQRRPAPVDSGAATPAISSMATQQPEYGTLMIAALLILALLFAGQWIISYVTPGDDPHALFPWFGIGAAAIVVVGLGIYVFSGWRSRR